MNGMKFEIESNYALFFIKVFHNDQMIGHFTTRDANQSLFDVWHDAAKIHTEWTLAHGS